MKKFYTIVFLLILILTACRGQEDVKPSPEDSNIEEDADSADIMKREDGVYYELVYIDGKKTEVQFTKYGAHLQMAYLDKIYFINEVDYRELKLSDNNLFRARLEKSPVSGGDEIVSYHKHGNMWHVITKNGEYYTDKDPEIKTGDQEYVGAEFTYEAKKEDGVFEKIYRHRDHVHVWYEGEEYIISSQEYEEAVKNGTFIPHEDHEGGH